MWRNESEFIGYGNMRSGGDSTGGEQHDACSVLHYEIGSMAHYFSREAERGYAYKNNMKNFFWREV